MNHKTLTQISLIFLVFFLVGFFYFKYFYEDNKNQKVQNIKDKIESSSSTDDNIVREIFYEKLDNKTGNKYTIISDYGQFDDEEKKIILMSNVTAKMTFKNGTVANLKSNRARYNTISGNTNFIDNVTVNYLIHQINSDHMNVFFDKSLLEAYGNLVYRNLEYNLVADKVELNLINNDTKIFMFDNSSVILTNN